MRSKGFTIVELVIVVTVMALLSSLMFGPLTDLYTSNTTSSAQVTQDSDVRSALRRIASDLTSANGFVDTIPSPVTPTGSNNSTAPWNFTTASAGASANVDVNTQVLMGKVYATDLPYGDENRMPVGAGSSCDLTLQTFIQNTLVYFVKSGVLYRRTMTNTPNAGTPCVAIAQKQSCDTTNATNCEAKDAILLKNVTSFLVKYDSDPTSTTPAALAQSAEISVQTQPTSSTSPVTPSKAVIRISLIQQTS